ncbi:hypothetical protein [Algoriphagus oliviformis]|nr:hypothetical protein [Algoriphagus oliviformis]
MIKNRMVFCLGLGLLLMLFSCSPSSRDGVDENQFAGYWYQGKAEINVFDLQQSRYGEVRPGKAVMIFVTEDFSKRKQVKLDDPKGNASDAQKVMKLNMTRDFVTGIYPYHTMLSVFTPVYEESFSPKITASVTEWCGQSFTQLNFKNGTYQIKQFSYFESEGDSEAKVNAMPEDELFNLIRLNPELVPTGSQLLLPSLIFQRFAHTPLKAENASIARRDLASNQSEVVVEYSNIGRRLSIRFEKFFPHEILGFEESWTREDGKKETTTATRTHMKLTDYWNQNGTMSEPLRKELGL